MANTRQQSLAPTYACPERGAAEQKCSHRSKTSKRRRRGGTFIRAQQGLLVALCSALLAGCAGTGPEPGEVEKALVADAKKTSEVELKADCPNDTSAKSDGDTFKCRVSNRSGDSVKVAIRMRQQDFTWDGRVVAGLAAKEEVLGGSGAAEDPVPDSETAGDCIILGTGNKLCGPDAKSYCEGTSYTTLDVDSIKVCTDIITATP